MFDVNGFDLVAAVVVIWFAAAVQGTIGLGFNIVAVPVLLLVNPLLAPVPQLILSVPQTAASMVRERGGIDRSGVAWILAGRIPGAVIGIWLLSIATDRLLEFLIGGFVITAVLILATGYHVNRTPAVEFGAGVFAGISSYVSSIGGPPMALLYSRAEGATIRATLGLIFLVGSSITLTARILAGDIAARDWGLALAMFPAAAVGFATSSWMKRHTSPRQLRVAILAVSAIAAGALLVRAVAGG